MSTLVLVGDSIFANAAYVNGPDVRAQVETKMPEDWAVYSMTLCLALETTPRERYGYTSLDTVC